MGHTDFTLIDALSILEQNGGEMRTFGPQILFELHADGKYIEKVFTFHKDEELYRITDLGREKLANLREEYIKG